tara:strand:+ start:3358 stop:3600 length:243 start_codon:yes stop_codon:yes gene_type:complete
MATLLKSDGSKQEKVNVSTLKSMQDMVGGYIEFIYLPKSKILIVDEEGRLKNYPLNQQASELCGQLIVGDVILADNSEVN